MATTLFSPAGPRHGSLHRPLPDTGSPGAPHSVWIAPPHALKSPISEGSELPVWAFEDACHEYAPNGGGIAVTAGPIAPFDAAVTPGPLAPTWLHRAEHVDLHLLALEPVALAVVLDDPPPYPDLIDREHDGWHHERVHRFYSALYAALAPGGIALVHTHTAPTPHGLYDPAATIIREAQIAGLAYLQHVVIVHTRLDVPTTARYRAPAQRPVESVCRRVHSDLYVLTKEDAR